MVLLCFLWDLQIFESSIHLTTWVWVLFFTCWIAENRRFRLHVKRHVWNCNWWQCCPDQMWLCLMLCYAQCFAFNKADVTSYQMLKKIAQSGRGRCRWVSKAWGEKKKKKSTNPAFPLWVPLGMTLGKLQEWNDCLLIQCEQRWGGGGSWLSGLVRWWNTAILTVSWFKEERQWLHGYSMRSVPQLGFVQLQKFLELKRDPE